MIAALGHGGDGLPRVGRRGVAGRLRGGRGPDDSAGDVHLVADHRGRARTGGERHRRAFGPLVGRGVVDLDLALRAAAETAEEVQLAVDDLGGMVVPRERSGCQAAAGPRFRRDVVGEGRRAALADDVELAGDEAARHLAESHRHGGRRGPARGGRLGGTGQVQ